MNLFGKDLDKEVVIVAAINQNHEGDIERAKCMIELAKDAGADAVKFQSFTPEKLCPLPSGDLPPDDQLPPEDVRYLERRRRAMKHALSTVNHLTLFDAAEVVDIPFFSTPMHLEWANFLYTLGVPAFKIDDIKNMELLKAVAATGKPVLLSTGGATHNDIDIARSTMEMTRGHGELILLHCSAAYPPPVDELNLAVFDRPPFSSGYRGYSCHTPDISVCVAAVALGARVLEVHFTDLAHGARSTAEFHDHLVSFTADQFNRLRHEVDKINSALGDGIKRPMPCEQPFLELMKEIRG